MTGLHGEEIIGALAVAGGIMITLMFIIFRTATQMHRTKETEVSRREIAAYVAEGSMTPAEGERLLDAGRKKIKT